MGTEAPSIIPILGETMTKKEWEKFFDLLEKVVNLPGLSVDEKMMAVRAAFTSSSDEMNLGEFLSWDW